jgi:hypothetical protein
MSHGRLSDHIYFYAKKIRQQVMQLARCVIMGGCVQRYARRSTGHMTVLKRMTSEHRHLWVNVKVNLIYIACYCRMYIVE